MNLATRTATAFICVTMSTISTARTSPSLTARVGVCAVLFVGGPLMCVCVCVHVMGAVCECRAHLLYIDHCLAGVFASMQLSTSTNDPMGTLSHSRDQPCPEACLVEFCFPSTAIITRCVQ